MLLGAIKVAMSMRMHSRSVIAVLGYDVLIMAYGP